MRRKHLSFLSFLLKHPVPLILSFLLLYLIVGAAAPFWRPKSLSPETKKAIESASFRQEEPGQDRAMLLETNQSAWDERMRLMSMAKERIILSTFDFRDGESPRDLMALMLHKADQGVKVSILVDGFSGLVRMEPSPMFRALSTHPNIQIKIYNPMNPLLPWKTQGRMHDKYVIADDIGYILGGRNTFDYFIGSYPSASRSHDREVLIYNEKQGTPDSAGSSLYQVESYFNRVWNLDVCRLFHDSPKEGQKKKVAEACSLLKERYKTLSSQYPELFCEADPSPALSYYQKATVPAGKITLVSNPTGIYGKEPVVFCTMARLIKEAKEQVNVHTPYAVFNDFMYDTMKEAASQIPVTMMINSVENGDNFFASSDYPLHKKKFLETGIKVLEYDGGTSYHGKSIVIDQDLCAVGSYNFDLRSTYLDTELMLVIESPALTAQLKDHMASYEKDCRTLLPDGSYYIPDHVTVAPVPLWKQAAWKIVGFVMQPFRFLI